MTPTRPRSKSFAILATLVLLMVSSTAGAGKAHILPVNPITPDHGNQTGGGGWDDGFRIFSGDGNKSVNETQGLIPDLPLQASDRAKKVTETISNAFNSVGDFTGGIGSFLSESLPVIGGPEQQTQPVNGTDSTEG